MTNLIINFWYGKIKLWKSYWIVGELLYNFIFLLIFTFEIRFLKNYTLYNQIPYFQINDFNFFSKIFLFAITIFFTVGIWRSAEEYKGRFIWIVLTLMFLSYRVFSLRLILF